MTSLADEYPHVPLSDDAAPSPSRRHKLLDSPLRPWPFALNWVLGFAVVTTIGLVLGAHSSWWYNADLVRGLLQGSVMAHGNPLLHHWASSGDSFLTIDLVFFAVAIALFGQHLFLLHLVASGLWGALVMSMGYLVGFGASTRARRLGWAMLIAIVLLPTESLLPYLSQSLQHVGTIFYVLVVFALLIQPPSKLRWGLATALLTLTLYGDPLSFFYGALPLAVIGALFGGWSLRERARSPFLLSAVVASVLGYLCWHFSTALGAVRMTGTSPLANWKSLAQSAHEFWPTSLKLFGLNGYENTTALTLGLGFTRGLIFLIALAGIALTSLELLRALPRPSQPGTGMPSARLQLKGLLLVGLVADLTTYFGLYNENQSTRYLTYGVVVTVLLGAMWLGDHLDDFSKDFANIIVVATALCVVLSSANALRIIEQPVPANPYSQVIRFLEQHHLQRGLVDYWSTTPITVYSGGRVAVRPVLAELAGPLRPYVYLADDRWFNEGYQFFICAQNEHPYDLDYFYGFVLCNNPSFPYAPAKVYTVGDFRVAVWKSGNFHFAKV